MREQIINESIKSLREEGLKFSVDTLANRLKISKKTIYKYFPNKEALALALYEKYYIEAQKAAEILAESNSSSALSDILYLYFDSKMMIRRDVFNKYTLNESIFAYTVRQNNALWEIISTAFDNNDSQENLETIRIIVDGAFEKLCDDRKSPDAVIERLVRLL